MGGSSFLLASFGIVLISSTYVMACCDEKTLSFLEALKEMKECKGLLKSSLKSSLLEKEELKLPPTLILAPALPPQLPQACQPPPPPLYLPAPQPQYLPPPQYAPYPQQQPCQGPSLPPIYLPSPPPFAFPPPPSYPPPSYPSPSPCSCGLPPLPALPGPLAITIVPPVAPPAGYPAPPAYPAPQYYPPAPKPYPAPQAYPAPQPYPAPSPYGPPALPCGAAPIPMNAFMMQAPVPVTLEPKPIKYLPPPSCGCQAPPPPPSCKCCYA